MLKLFRCLFSEKTMLAITSAYSIRICALALGFYTQILFAQLLGASNYGIFSLMWVIATILGQASTLGFNETTNRFLPTYLSQGKPHLALGFVKFSYMTVMQASSLLICILILSVFLFSAYLPGHYYLPLIFALLCVPITAMTHLQESFAISRTWVIRGLLPSFVVRPLILILSTYILIKYLNLEATATLATLALLFSCIFAFFLQTILLKNPLAEEIGKTKASYKKGFWFKSSIPLILSQGFVILAVNIDILVLSFLTSPDKLGVYFAAAKIVSLISFIHIAIGQIITRKLAEAVATSKMDMLTHYFNQYRRLMIYFSISLSVIFIIFSTELMLIFGEEFAEGGRYLSILVFISIVHACGGPLKEYLIVLGKQKDILRITSISLVLNFILNLIFFMMLGLEGVAIASVISAIVQVVMFWLVKKKSNILEAKA